MESSHKSQRRRIRKKKKIFVADQVDKEGGPTVKQLIVIILIAIAVIWLSVRLIFMS